LISVHIKDDIIGIFYLKRCGFCDCKALKIILRILQTSRIFRSK